MWCFFNNVGKLGKFTAYKVQLASLPDGHHEQDFICDTEFFKDMENPDVISSDVAVHLDLEKRNGAYDCTFTCKGKLQIPCDRCLDALDHEVDTVYHIIVKYGEDYDDASDELLIIPESDAYLNVAYMLADTILLTIPLRHVHPKGECNKAMASVLRAHSDMNDDEADIDEEYGIDSLMED